MGDVDELFVIMYWMIGILLTLFIIDYFWYKPIRENKNTDKIIKNLRRKNKEFRHVLPKAIGKGIVICVGADDIYNVKLLITTLRKNNCQLPILICYAGDELSDGDFKDLSALPGVTLSALGPKLDIPLELLRGPQIRAYALIHSPFQETLMIAPDVLFFTNPEYLFSDPNYINSGAMFWRDKKQWGIMKQKTYDWVRRLIPYRKGDNRILDKKSADWQSGDLLLLNKANHLKTLENLWVLTNEWDTVYSYLPGDKECYWISAELAKEPYYFVDYYPGAIGEMSMDRICGHVLHLDSSGRLLAWNGGLYHSKQITDFTHYSLFIGNAEWYRGCLKGGDQKHLPDGLKELFNSYAKISHDGN